MVIRKIASAVFNLLDRAAGKVGDRNISYNQIVEFLEQSRPRVVGSMEFGVSFNGQRYRTALSPEEALQRFRANYHYIGGSGSHLAFEVLRAEGNLIEHHIRFRRNPLPGYEHTRAGAFIIFRTPK